MLGYAPFLGQVAYHPSVGQFDSSAELRKSRVENRNSSLKSTLDFYSPWWTSFDPSTTARLEAKIETCRTAILKILTDPDADIATAGADSCVDDLSRQLYNARAAYFAQKDVKAGSLSTTDMAVGLLVLASGSASAYHGYKRNNSVGWGIGWGVLGLLFPVITPTVAVIQGFGKRAK
jgi:hypothetical protein